MQIGKHILGVIGLLAFLCVGKAVAQPSQLPSLLEDDMQYDYFKNAVLQPGEEPSAKINGLIFIKTQVSKSECFVGEPVLVTYQLYSAVSCHSRVTRQVSFTGCSVIEMTSDEPEQLVRDGNKTYRVQLIRRVQLIPLRPGDLQIPPATVNNDVSFATPDNPYAQKSYSADVSSHPLAIHVNALPGDKPAGFTGVTGKYSIRATTDSNTIAAGESNRLQITISGAGNIEAITEPQISWPQNTEHFDVQDSQHINRLNFPESGDKTYIIPFISTQKGNVTIPEVSFTYFNTEHKQFETISTTAIPLVITASQPQVSPAAEIGANEVPSNKKLLWIVPGIAAFVVTGWLLTGRKPKKAVAPNNGPAAVEEELKEAIPAETTAAPQRPDYAILLQALNEAEDNKTFFGNAKTLLVGVLQSQFSTGIADEATLVEMLRQKDAALATEARQVLAVCNEELYSPVENDEERNAVSRQLSHLINQLRGA